MSTAVYLATSCYINKLAVRERSVPVTPRNVHRLILAGLRVAMKALEDLSWPHGRFSKVGGVSDSELGRLEVAFCFLMDFGLRVDREMLEEEARELVRGVKGENVLDSPASMKLELPPEGGRRSAEKRKASSALPTRPAMGMDMDRGREGREIVGQG